MLAEFEQTFIDRPELVERVKKNCIDADVKEYDPEGTCELKKIAYCMRVKYAMVNIIFNWWRETSLSLITNILNLCNNCPWLLLVYVFLIRIHDRMFYIYIQNCTQICDMTKVLHRIKCFSFNRIKRLQTFSILVIYLKPTLGHTTLTPSYDAIVFFQACSEFDDRVQCYEIKVLAKKCAAQ